MSDPKSAASAAKSYRQFPGRRLILSFFRILHLTGIVGVGSGLLHSAPLPSQDMFLVLLVGSGVAMFALDFWSNPAYVRQMAGAAMFAKLLLVAWFAFDPAQRAWLFWAMLVFSTLIAHAPGRIRHRSLFGRVRGA